MSTTDNSSRRLTAAGAWRDFICTEEDRAGKEWGLTNGSAGAS